MCGIVGAVSTRSVTSTLLQGLKKLEYRGYDSAGLAVINEALALQHVRCVGKVHTLQAAVDAKAVMGQIGIAHTRWATHGAPSENNAHPFISHDTFALVHNGIIENHAQLRQQLITKGYKFHSSTDTEVIVHLIYDYFLQSHEALSAIRAACLDLEGAYALAIIHKQDPQRLYAVRKGSPLVIGRGRKENYIASDPLALLSLTQEFHYLEDDDIASIGIESIAIFSKENQLVTREVHHLDSHANTNNKGNYRHYMQKEMFEQATAMRACLSGRANSAPVSTTIFGDEQNIFPNVENIYLVACGTSFHAALVAKYWIESLAQVPCTVEVASEFRYRAPVKVPHCLFVTLSQSGETADSLAALKLAKQMNYLSTLCICNVSDSSMIREADLHFITHAGPEIGVASTKAFITQLTALLLLTLTLMKNKHSEAQALLDAIQQAPQLLEKVLQCDETMAEWATQFTNKQHALYLGRGVLYPIALEGALKMKELSYIHAEAYPAGELKHGPLALVDNEMPVVALVASDGLLGKMLSNLEEVRTRGGKIFLICDDQSIMLQNGFDPQRTVIVPKTHAQLTPLLYTLPLQLLAYHVAVLKGTDVDQPRNLAKSVTVE